MTRTSYQKGFSLIELLIVVAIIGIIASIAIPSMLASRRAANEGSAVSSLRTIHSAQVTYMATAGEGKYGSLVDLGSQRLLDEVMSAGSKSGYTFVCPDTYLTPGPPPTYYATAIPADTTAVGRTGTRSFAIAEDGALRGKITDIPAADHDEATDSVTWPPINN